MVRIRSRQGLSRPRLGFWRAERGATAVEFALVAGPFVLLMIGVLELGLIFMASVTLENATAMASRRIRTGELVAVAPGQEAASSAAFKTEICNDMGWMQADCENNLWVDVNTYSDFNSETLPSPVVNGAFQPGTPNFKPGTAGSIVLVRAWYQWDLIAPLMNQALVKVPGKTLIASTATFRNEPYLGG
jgi:Flp pilus assembly protein TadG